MHHNGKQEPCKFCLEITTYTWTGTSYTDKHLSKDKWTLAVFKESSKRGCLSCGALVDVLLHHYPELDQNQSLKFQRFKDPKD
jgi:hypothetical protein